MQFSESHEFIGEELRLPVKKTELFSFGNTTARVDISVGRDGKAELLDNLVLSAGDQQVSLVGLLPNDWQARFRNIQDMGISGVERTMLIPYKRKSTRPEEESNKYSSLWGEYSADTQPYLSSPSFVLPFLHEIAHTKQEQPDLKNSMISAIEGNEVGWTEEQRKKREVEATEVAIEEMSKLVEAGFDFGKNFNQTEVAQEITNALKSYDIEDGEIDRLIELARTKLFQEKSDI